MALETKSRQGSYTSVIAQCHAAMREADGRMRRTISGPGVTGTSINVKTKKDRESNAEQNNSAQDVPKTAQEAPASVKSKAAETPAERLARVITAEDDKAVVSIAKSLVAEVVSSMMDETGPAIYARVAVNGYASRKRRRNKQEGHPRLLKLPVDPHRTCPEHMKNRSGRVGVYLPQARKERIARFHSKRQDRIARFCSKDFPLHDVRRKKAKARKREGGRFVKKMEEGKTRSVQEILQSGVADDVSEVSAREEEEEEVTRQNGLENELGDPSEYMYSDSRDETNTEESYTYIGNVSGAMVILDTCK